MAIPEAGQDLIEGAIQRRDFGAVLAMLSYAMAVGHLSPGEYSARFRLVEAYKNKPS